MTATIWCCLPPDGHVTLLTLGEALRGTISSSVPAFIAAVIASKLEQLPRPTAVLLCLIVILTAPRRVRQATTG